MKTKLNLNMYHHLVVLAKDTQKAVDTWAEVFHFEAPPLYSLGDVYGKFLKEHINEYPSLYRGNVWMSDFKQAVFNEHSFFFEIDGTGEESDCFTEFEKEHGNGICYLGFLAGAKRDDFVSELNNSLDCATIVDQKFPGGDWSVMETNPVLGCNLCIKKEPGGDHTENPKIVDFSEVSILVENLDKAVSGWKEVFEIETVTCSTIQTEAVYKGEQISISCKAAELTGGPFPIHLIEAKEEGPFADYVKEHGYCIFAVAVPVADQEKEKKHIEDECGFQQLLNMELFGKKYCIYDTVNTMGTNIAI